MTNPWELRLDELGAYIREQRKQARLSLRELAEIAQVSNPYLSQIERGLHEPSVRVLRSIANALNLSAESMLEHAGLLEGSVIAESPGQLDTEKALRADPYLSPEQKDALLVVYRTYRRANKALP